MMKVGVIGNGVVGSATARSYLGFASEVLCHDVRPERCTHDARAVLSCDVVFICLPTPQTGGGIACDTSYIKKFLSYNILSGFPYPRGVLAVRSTVPIGYTASLQLEYPNIRLVHCPEFLTARTADVDARMPARNIVGFTTRVEEAACEDHPLVKLLHFRFPHVPVHTMTSDESEAVKLFQNAFSAVKVACFNEFRCLADRLELRWDEVLDALLAGGYICPIHTQVPGPDGKRGFGGACLPKDLANLMQCIRDAGLEDLVTYAAYMRNKQDRAMPTED